jgi:hypothetical protein
MGRCSMRVSLVSVLDRRFKMRGGFGDVGVLIARVLSLRIDQGLFGMMGDAVRVAALSMGDGLLCMCNSLTKVVVGIADHGVNRVTDRVFGPRDLWSRERNGGGGK